MLCKNCKQTLERKRISEEILTSDSYYVCENVDCDMFGTLTIAGIEEEDWYKSEEYLNKTQQNSNSNIRCENCEHELEVRKDCEDVFCKKCGKRWILEDCSTTVQFGCGNSTRNPYPWSDEYKVYC